MECKTLIGLLAVLLLFQLSCQASLDTDPSYRAAVVEFAVSPDLNNGNEQMEINLANILKIILSNATNNLDIIVFPEYALSNMETKTYVPDPADNIIPCESTDYHYYLTQISCAARSVQVYVVINILEKVDCQSNQNADCPKSDQYIYNTNVVFDRDGAVISRYRKTHLYGDEWYSTQVLKEPELATFTTDFGVTFGHFICFDMLFYTPAISLIRSLNITDIIYPTYWYSELPFLVATQLQEGWAFGNDVNLLAAGGSYPSQKNTGSGIYAGALGRLVAAIFEEPTTKVLTAEVPKMAYRSDYIMKEITESNQSPSFETLRLTKLSLLRDNNIDIFSTKLLSTNFTTVDNEVICHNNFCCNFQITRVLLAQSTAHSTYRYRLAAYYGDKTTFQGKDPSSMAVCAVLACNGTKLYNCGQIYPAGVLVGNSYYFSKLEISGNFPNAVRRLIMPSSVDGEMMPLPVSMYDMQEVQGGNSTHVSISLKSPKADILTFGIWGNYFNMLQSAHNLKLATRTSGTYRESSASKLYCIFHIIVVAYILNLIS